jgi:hypothetical protein
MDESTLMNAGLSTTGVALLLIAWRIFKSVQGKKIISSCCGKKMEMGMDVVPMTPQHMSIDMPNPLRRPEAPLPRQETLGVPEREGNPPI